MPSWIFQKPWSSFLSSQSWQLIQSSNTLSVRYESKNQRLSNNLLVFIAANAEFLVRNIPNIQKQVGNFFDVHKIFKDNRIFSNLGKILCGKPFPRSDNIRFVENIIYSPDYNGPDKDELDVMPSRFYRFVNANY
jgi:hypothetical protein